MSYPPNNPTITKRSPQHGIHIAGLSSPSTTSVKTSKSTPPRPVMTVSCATAGCPNKVTIVPFGYHQGGPMNIKVNCKECYVPVVVAVKEGGEKIEEEEWKEEKWENEGDGDGDGW
jgi:hypothetical protein